MLFTAQIILLCCPVGWIWRKFWSVIWGGKSHHDVKAYNVNHGWNEKLPWMPYSHLFYSEGEWWFTVQHSLINTALVVHKHCSSWSYYIFCKPTLVYILVLATLLINLFRNLTVHSFFFVFFFLFFLVSPPKSISWKFSKTIRQGKALRFTCVTNGAPYITKKHFASLISWSNWQKPTNKITHVLCTVIKGNLSPNQWA